MPIQVINRYRYCGLLLLTLLPLLVWHHRIATIRTPPFVQLVPGRLLWDNAQTVMDLDTGVIHAAEADKIFYRGNKRIGIDFLRENEQLSVFCQTVGDVMPKERFVIDMWGSLDLLSSRYLIALRERELQTIDLLGLDIDAGKVKTASPRVLTTQLASLPIAPVPIAAAGGFHESIIPLDGTNRFLFEYKTAGRWDYALYEIEPDKIRLLNTWTGAGYVHHSNDCLYALTAGNAVEVRSVVDGSYVELIPYPDTSDTFVGVVNVGIHHGILSLGDSEYANFVLFDLARKQVLNFPDSHYFPVNTSPHLILRGSLNRNLDQLLAVDLRSGRVVGAFASPLAHASIDNYDEDHLCFSSEAHGMTAILVDAITGKEVDRWAPYAWISRSSLLLIPLMIAWMVGWCFASARAHLPAWIDVFMVVGLSFLMASYRVTELATFTLATAACVLFVGVQCAAWWFFNSKLKLLTRLSILILTIGLAQAAFVTLMREQASSPRWALLIASGLAVALFGSTSQITRWRGWWLSCPDPLPTRPTSIRDYLALTITAAVAVNSARITLAISSLYHTSSSSC